MQPDPQPHGQGREKAGRLPPPVTAAPAGGRPASVLPHKTANVRDHYRIGKKLGQGQFGTTYLCVSKSDGGGEFACKSIPKRKLLCREDYEDVWREIQIMHHLSAAIGHCRTPQIGLVLEIVVNEWGGNPVAAGDIRNRSAIIAALAKRVESSG